ncbi:hypothetical protein REJ26_000411 [Providencia stuartii]|uniref:Uncharacterized protein n=1 Tax=Providencia stuartii TaxID=588 RepID=A0A1S1HN81_PROST|nr:hypothetical protein [Providencia sp. 2023EL-00965]ELR5111097.1 hypothetical protein [Providencia stuartii]MDV5225653.1 hypothetical protein [Providencia rettgeri]ELR5298694.1 hypothetical protein [Providencia stuartii]MDW7587144.1 hypothetical protein [Providencia sp. 2023EL-00965]OHT23744.1 hypothetical protein A3Q29_19930 [Providencia stuartii]
MKRHPNKHIQMAIEYAVSKGWILVEAGQSSHAFCRLRCGDPNREHQNHQMSVWSTPSSPENHAKQIKRKVDSCI